MCVLIAPSEEDEEEDDDDDDSEAWAHDCEALMDAYRKRTNSIQVLCSIEGDAEHEHEHEEELEAWAEDVTALCSLTGYEQ